MFYDQGIRRSLRNDYVLQCVTPSLENTDISWSIAYIMVKQNTSHHTLFVHCDLDQEDSFGNSTYNESSSKMMKFCRSEDKTWENESTATMVSHYMAMVKLHTTTVICKQHFHRLVNNVRYLRYTLPCCVVTCKYARLCVLISST